MPQAVGATAWNMGGATPNLTDQDIMFLCTSVPPQTMCQFAMMYLGVTHDQIRTFIAEEGQHNVQNVGFKCLEWWRNSYQGSDARGTLYGYLMHASNANLRAHIRQDHFAILDPEHQTQIGKNLYDNINYISSSSVRPHSLYSTVDESSDELETGPTRKKNDNSAFFFILLLRHALELSYNYVICR